MIRGSFRDRIKARDLAASIIATLKKNQSPVVWAIVPQFGTVSTPLTSLDILKNLVLQILQMNKSILEDYSQPLSAIKFQCATTESEWFDLLVLVLTGIPTIYMVIDIEVFRSDLENGPTWPVAFVKLFQKLAARSPGTAVKVAIISYHTKLDFPAPGTAQENAILLNMKAMERREKVVRTKFSGTSFRMNTRRTGC
jgi:hypothetical protein